MSVPARCRLIVIGVGVRRTGEAGAMVADGTTPTAEQDEVEGTAGPPRWIRPLRRRVHRVPAGALLWKIGVGVVGAAIVVAGLLLIPLPGPGWAIVFLGIAVWATEFSWARRLLARARRLLRQWTEWLLRLPPLIRALIGLAGLAFLLVLAYLVWRLVP